MLYIIYILSLYCVIYAYAIRFVWKFVLGAGFGNLPYINQSSTFLALTWLQGNIQLSLETSLQGNLLLTKTLAHILYSYQIHVLFWLVVHTPSICQPPMSSHSSDSLALEHARGATLVALSRLPGLLQTMHMYLLKPRCRVDAYTDIIYLWTVYTHIHI